MSDYRQYRKVFQKFAEYLEEDKPETQDPALPEVEQQLALPSIAPGKAPVTPAPKAVVAPKPPAPNTNWRQLHLDLPPAKLKRDPQLGLPFDETATVNCAEDGCEYSASLIDLHKDESNGKYYCGDHMMECSNDDCYDRKPVAKMKQDERTEDYYCDQHIVKCDECRYFVSTTDCQHEYDGKPLCDSCYSEEYFYCDHCDEVRQNSDLVSGDAHHRGRSEYWGCDECSHSCEYRNCNVAALMENMEKIHGDWYCEECVGEHFYRCDGCEVYMDSDDVHSVHDNVYCERCYNRDFFYCSECETDQSNDGSQEVEDDRGNEITVCKDCYEDKYASDSEGEVDGEDGQKLPTLPKAYSNYKSVGEIKFDFSKKTRDFTMLRKFLPISVKDLKKKLPQLAQKLTDFIQWSQGKTLTSELVDQYKKDKTIPKGNEEAETYRLKYNTWNSSLQRSVRNKLGKPQLVISILPGPEMMAKINADPIKADILDWINLAAKKSSHPVVTEQIGWARVDLDPEGQYILVDEIQTDHENGCWQLRNWIKNPNIELKEGLREIRDRLISKHDIDDQALDKKLVEFMEMIKEFPSVAATGVRDFAIANGFKKLFWHTYESGKALKGNAPPKSLYDDVPKENHYMPSSEKPFGLNGKFFEREAERSVEMHKLARKIFLRHTGRE